MSRPQLIADVGGTNARFALLRDGDFTRVEIYAVADHERIEDAVRAYIAGVAAQDRPVEGAFAVAGPVTGDRIIMMNSPWSFSIAAMRREFGWDKLHVINDFAANALSVPDLPAKLRLQVGGGTPAAAAPVAVLGPGTGLGAGGLVPSPSGWIAVAGEGGNVTFAPSDSRESAIVDILRRQYAHVSAELVLSGPGLVNLYESLCELAGKPAAPATPEHITNIYPGCDPQCREAVSLFCAILGSFAGDLAMTFGARGGVYIMGGIVPKIFEIFRHSQFRDKFESKGRYREYLSAIPTYVVAHPFPAFLGLKTLFRH